MCRNCHIPVSYTHLAFKMDTSKIVGEKIKALREDKSISIEELAQRSGLAIEQVERCLLYTSYILIRL